MALRTVSTNTFFDQISGMTNGDSVEITTGAVLTIRQSNPNAKPAGITVTDGTLVIDPSLHPTVPNTPIRFQMYTRDYGITVKSAGNFICHGGWYNLGTGDGQAGQTLTTWYNVNDVFCPHIQVETGNGTGIYEDWVNIGQARDLTNIPGDSARGYYFYMVAGSKAVKSGNGSNAGAVFPNGANIRCSNVLLDVDTYYSDQSGTVAKVRIEDGGTCDLTNFSTINNFMFEASKSGDLKLTNCAFGYQVNIMTCGKLTWDGVFVAYHRRKIQELFYFNNVYGGGTVKRLKSVCNQSRGFYTFNVFNVEFTDIWSAALTYAQGESVNLSQMNNCKITNFYVAGGYMTLANYNTNLTIENLKYTQRFNSALAQYGRMLRMTNQRNLKINNVSLWSANGAQDTYARPAAAGVVEFPNCSPFRLTNVNLPYTNSDANAPAISANVLANDVVFARWDLGAFNQQLTDFGTNSNLTQKFKMMNIKTTSSVAIGQYNLFGLADVQLKSVMATNVDPTGNAGAGIGNTFDMAFHSLCDVNGTDGRLALMANPESSLDYFSVLSGAPYFSNDNKLRMRVAGDSVEFVCPFPILGVSAIKNVAPTLVSSGVTLAHITISVKQEGGDWSSWYNLNTDMATLAGLTFDPAVNFYWKARITVTGNSSTQYFSTLHIPILLTNSVLYPVSITTITLDNVVVGSTYYVYKNSDNSLIGSGTAIASTVEITDIPYASDENCTVRVRKPGYVPFETGIIMTEDGSSAWIAQVLDKVYQS